MKRMLVISVIALLFFLILTTPVCKDKSDGENKADIEEMSLTGKDYHYIAVPNLPLRTEPSPDSEMVEGFIILVFGDWVEVLEEKGEWYRVRVDGGLEGWVRATYEGEEYIKDDLTTKDYERVRSIPPLYMEGDSPMVDLNSSRTRGIDSGKLPEGKLKWKYESVSYIVQTTLYEGLPLIAEIDYREQGKYVFAKINSLNTDGESQFITNSGSHYYENAFDIDGLTKCVTSGDYGFIVPFGSGASAPTVRVDGTGSFLNLKTGSQIVNISIERDDMEKFFASPLLWNDRIYYQGALYDTSGDLILNIPAELSNSEYEGYPIIKATSALLCNRQLITMWVEREHFFYQEDRDRYIKTYIVSHRADNGDEMWNVEITPPDYSSISVWHNLLIATAGEYIYVINLLDGSKIWKRSYKGENFTTPALRYGFIFVHSNDGILAIDILSGDVDWKFKVEEPSKIAIADKRLYFTSNNTLYCLTAKDGEMIWKLNGLEGLPYISDGVVYVAGGPTIYAVE